VNWRRAPLCLRDVEYELRLGETATVVRGVLDVAWQDAAGAWHLLTGDDEQPPNRRVLEGTKKLA